jgi:hypothetical protein
MFDPSELFFGPDTQPEECREAISRGTSILGAFWSVLGVLFGLEILRGTAWTGILPVYFAVLDGQLAAGGLISGIPMLIGGVALRGHSPWAPEVLVWSLRAAMVFILTVTANAVAIVFATPDAGSAPVMLVTVLPFLLLVWLGLHLVVLRAIPRCS